MTMGIPTATIMRTTTSMITITMIMPTSTAPAAATIITTGTSTITDRA